MILSKKILRLATKANPIVPTLLLLALLATAACGGRPARLVVATTTSTENSGLLDAILPDFERRYNIQVDVVAVGTGQALKLGEQGDADLLLVHAPDLEAAFMQAGYGSRREPVMVNDFVLLGPPDDPAGTRGMNDVTAAFAQIAQQQAPFISRGDESGTHHREKAIWTRAGIEPSGPWYHSAGQGMGAVLTLANEQHAYTLSDRGTYLAYTAPGLDLTVLIEDDPFLLNPYSVIVVNSPHTQTDLANTFVDWLISVPTQERIGQFGVDRFGQPLFIPDSIPWRNAQQGKGGPL